MTALAEALLAAQRQAIGAASKAYVASREDGDWSAGKFEHTLNLIGCTDKVEQAQLLAALDVLREYGAPAPAATRQDRPPAKVTAPQRARIERTAKERNYPLPDFDNLTSAQASEVIQTMDSGEYDAARWVVPF